MATGEDVEWVVNSRYYEELWSEIQNPSLQGTDKAMRLRLLNQRARARKVNFLLSLCLILVDHELWLGDPF